MAAPIDDTHDPSRRSWVESADGDTDFPIQNLPLGVFSRPGEPSRGGLAIGAHILDLPALAATGLLDGEAVYAARAGRRHTLNTLLGLGAHPRRALRQQVSRLLSVDTADREMLAPLLYKMEDCTLHLPCAIGDYTDFYAGIHHAINVGRQFRPDAPLLGNYKHVPIGYHGRASSVRLSGRPVRRPNGQTKPPDAVTPRFGPSARLDYELELGVWIGPGNEADDTPIPIAEAGDHIAGYCLLNDWSARDIQAWEYQPLGPFLSKNFATTVSGWIVTPEALAPFRIVQPERPAGDPAPLPYLRHSANQADGALDVALEVLLHTRQMRRHGLAPHRLALSNTRHLYWTPAQLVAHHTSGGCDLLPGDLLGTGTISGSERASVGSLLEASVGGREPIILPSGERRAFLEDGDEVILRGRAHRAGFVSIGFGECRAEILPAAPATE